MDKIDNTTNENRVLFSTLEAAHKSELMGTNDESVIHISELTGLPSFMYEKLRTIIDYKDEQLLRKNAIKRFLRRSLLVPKFSAEPSVIAHRLIRELILSRYIKNDSVPEKIILLLTKVITKYFLLVRALQEQNLQIPRWREDIAGLAAVECDAYIHNPVVKNTYLTYSYQLLSQIIDISDINDSFDEKKLQLVISIQRVLERADRDTLMHYILLHYYPEWHSEIDPNTLVMEFAPKAQLFFCTSERLISAELGRRLLPIVRRLLVPMMVIRDLFTKKILTARDFVNFNSKVERVIQNTYQTHWQNLRRKLRRKGFHAMTYIFFTKVLLALLIELPYERFVYGHITLLPLWLNIAVPPLLMFIITMLIKSPNKTNESMMIEAVRELSVGNYVNFYKIQHLKERNRKIWTKVAYLILYLFTITGSFGAILFVLWKLNFNPISAGLFIFFVSLVSFFGISLRQQARQLKIIKGRETIVSFLIDFFSLPIITLGKWLSITFNRINIFVFILDFIFELPFKTLLKIIEDWFAYLREKKDEII